MWFYFTIQIHSFLVSKSRPSPKQCRYGHNSIPTLDNNRFRELLIFKGSTDWLAPYRTPLNPIEQLLPAPLSGPIFPVKCVIADNPAPCCQLKIKRPNRSLPKSKLGKVRGENSGKKASFDAEPNGIVIQIQGGALDRAREKWKKWRGKTTGTRKTTSNWRLNIFWPTVGNNNIETERARNESAFTSTVNLARKGMVWYGEYYMA